MSQSRKIKVSLEQVMGSDEWVDDVIRRNPQFIDALNDILEGKTPQDLKKDWSPR